MGLSPVDTPPLPLSVERKIEGGKESDDSELKEFFPNLLSSFPPSR